MFIVAQSAGFSNHWKKDTAFLQSMEKWRGISNVWKIRGERNDHRGNQKRSRARRWPRRRRRRTPPRWRPCAIKYLGPQGPAARRSWTGSRTCAPAERPEAGQARQRVQERADGAGWTARKAALEQAARGAPAGAAFDYTLPGRWRGLGSLHPVTHDHRASDGRSSVRLGFTVADGPDIETEYHNFDALNTPADHPVARPAGHVLPGDRRAAAHADLAGADPRMEKQKPPVRIIAPGPLLPARHDRTPRTARTSTRSRACTWTASVSLADLKGDLTYFARADDGAGREGAVPAALLPVHRAERGVRFLLPRLRRQGLPRVQAQRLDRDRRRRHGRPARSSRRSATTRRQVTGYAFGMGVERIAMILYGIQDIRMLYENDVRFLAQF